MTMITIFADASLCPKTGAAGWGAWAKRDGGASRTWSGPIKVAVANSTEAEIRALASALQATYSDGLLAGIDTVMLQSDNTLALGIIKRIFPFALETKHAEGASISVPTKMRISHVATEASGDIGNIILRVGCRVMLRHVRGHRPGEGRQWVNRKCDELARAEMERVRRGVIA